MLTNRRITLSLISSLAGYLIIVNACLSMTLSIIFGHLGFSPFDYWVEDYGTVSENLNGSAFYDVGIIITGVLLCIFIPGFYKWYTNNWWYNAFLIIGQIGGTVAGIILMLEGYTLYFDQTNPFMWSIFFYVAVIIAMIMATVGMLKSPNHHEDTITVGFTSITLIMLLAITLILNIAPVIIEWFALFSLTIWLSLASRDMYRLSTNNIRTT